MDSLGDLKDLMKAQGALAKCEVQANEGQKVTSGPVFRGFANCPLCIGFEGSTPKYTEAPLFNENQAELKRVSVIKPNQIQGIIDEVSAMKLPMELSSDGCQARAHLIAKHLQEKKGLSTAKIYLRGDLRHEASPIDGWQYHVAPVIYVHHGGKLWPMVIDILFSPDRLLSVDRWAQIAKGSAGAISDYRLSTMFSYDPYDYIRMPRREFRDSDTCRANDKLGINPEERSGNLEVEPSNA
ncbi:MAG: protein-glutamine glutaminase family protein [Pseudomonadota bacterium]